MPVQNFNMSPEYWRQHGRGRLSGVDANGGAPVRHCGHDIGITTDFPWSEKPDPFAGPVWNGYLVMEVPGNMLRKPSPKPNNVAWNKNNPQPLLPPVLSLPVESHLLFEFFFEITKDAQLNYQSDIDNTDKTTPAGFRPFIKSGPWSMMGAPHRWWSRQRVDLSPTDTRRSLGVSLDPSNWFNVNGHDGDSPGSGYLEALARPAYLGLTFGGGFFAGHGVNVSNGNARFHLHRFCAY